MSGTAWDTRLEEIYLAPDGKRISATEYYNRYGGCNLRCDYPVDAGFNRRYCKLCGAPIEFDRERMEAVCSYEGCGAVYNGADKTLRPVYMPPRFSDYYISKMAYLKHKYGTPKTLRKQICQRLRLLDNVYMSRSEWDQRFVKIVSDITQLPIRDIEPLL